MSLLGIFGGEQGFSLSIQRKPAVKYGRKPYSQRLGCFIFGIFFAEKVIFAMLVMKTYDASFN